MTGRQCWVGVLAKGYRSSVESVLRVLRGVPEDGPRPHTQQLLSEVGRQVALDKSGYSIGAGIAIGAGVGAALGVAFDNVGTFIAIGAGVGVALGAAISATRLRK